MILSINLSTGRALCHEASQRGELVGHLEITAGRQLLLTVLQQWCRVSLPPAIYRVHDYWVDNEEVNKRIYLSLSSQLYIGEITSAGGTTFAVQRTVRWASKGGPTVGLMTIISGFDVFDQSTVALLTSFLSVMLIVSYLQVSRRNYSLSLCRVEYLYSAVYHFILVTPPTIGCRQRLLSSVMRSINWWAVLT